MAFQSEFSLGDLDEDEEPRTPAPTSPTPLYIPSIMATHLFQPIPNTDPLSTLLAKYVPNPEMRPVRDVSGEWQHTEFHSLVMSNSWRALAHMARDRIVSSNPSDVATILSLWGLRLSALSRLRLPNQTAAECTNLFHALSSIDPPSHRDYVLDVLLPFDLEVMRARLKYWAGDFIGYLDNLSAIERKCKIMARRYTDQEDFEMWKERGCRVGLIIGSQLIEMKQFVAAANLLEPLCKQEHSYELRSAIGRIYLQSGDLRSASVHFGYVEGFPDAPDDPNLALTKAINRAMKATAKGNWPEAIKEWYQLLDKEPDDPIACNNLSVALLNEGKLQEAINVLESCLRTSPATVVVAEPFLFNLATLYELRSGTSSDKKRELLVEAAKWSGDGLRAAALKLSASG